MKVFCRAILLVVALGAAAQGQPIDIAIDIDSMRTSGSATGGSIATQPGFTSWDLTSFTGSGGSTITVDDVTFEIFGLGDNLSRFRANGGGGPSNELLRDFVFNESGQNAAIGIRVSGLPEGLYDVQSWHYDFDVLTVENFVQVEVRNQGDSFDPSQIHVDQFAFSDSAAEFQLAVTAPGQVKELIFREDDVATATDAGDQNRSRLNGFAIRTIPEPSSGVLGLAAIVGCLRRGRALSR